MKIKKYIVKDMNEALKLIRKDLGPDAVIISNYRLPRRRFFDFFTPRLLEVTAALDDKQTFYASPKKYIESSDNGASKLLEELRGFGPGGKRIAISVYGAGKADLPYLKEELVGAGTVGKRTNVELKETAPDGEKMVNLGNSPEERSLLYNYKGKIEKESEKTEVPFDIILKNKGNCLINREIDELWKKILTSLEIQESIVKSLVHGLQYELNKIDEISEEFETYLPYFKSKITGLLEPAYKPLPQHKVCIFVGPTGVGKTLTLAKLATHFVLHENKTVAMIAAFENSQKPDQLDTLKYYGGLVDVSVDCAGTTRELTDLLNIHSDKDYVFIDTLGVNSRNAGMMLRLSKLLHSFKFGKDIFLVLSSTTKSNDLIRISAEFCKIGYTKMIFTKLDETDTCGSILNVVCRIGVPVSFVSYGQNVPDDIAAVNPRKLAGLLLGGVDRYVEQGLQART